jgi:hypothetical protein
MRWVSTVVLFFAFVGVTACGESSAGSGVTADAGSGGAAGVGGGAAGVSGTGGSGAPGTGGAGASGTGGGSAGGTVGAGGTAGHCSPGTFLSDPVDTYPKGNVKVCYSYPQTDGGITITDNVAIRDIKTPGVTGGKPYTLSIEIRDHDVPRAELWGANEQCGSAGEKLWSGTMTAGVFCVTLNPTNSYSHLLMVWYTSAQHGSITLCPDGQCSQ